jgi:rubrerythrin
MRVAARAIADALQRLAGEAAKGEFRCLDCGYGIVITHTLPACPMCRGRGWQEADWRPFTRASNIA